MNENNPNNANTPQPSMLLPALLLASSELSNPKKDTKGHNYKYATLDQILEIVKPVLKRHQIGVLQSPTGTLENDSVSIKTILFHSSGESLTEVFQIPMQIKSNPTQDFGAAVTYGKRYALLSMLAICPEDEDTDGVGSKEKPKITPNHGRLMEEADKRIGNLNITKWAEAVFIPHKQSQARLEKFMDRTDEEILKTVSKWEAQNAG